MKTLSTLLVAAFGLLAFGATAAEFNLDNFGGRLWAVAQDAAENWGGDGASFPGAPGGRGGAAGVASPQTATGALDVGYCINILETGKAPQEGRSRPSNCAKIFLELDRKARENNGDALRSFCLGVLLKEIGELKQRDKSANGARGYALSDCIELFASWEWEGSRTTPRGQGPAGPDGPSVSGGLGGAGGKGGAGPAGGAGGAGGAGIKGGQGGMGGAGGTSD